MKALVCNGSYSARPVSVAAAVLLAVSVVVGVAGCEKAAGDACGVDADCASGLVCNMYSFVCSQPDEVCEANHHCKDPTKPVCNESHVCVAAPEMQDAGGGTDTVAPPRDVASDTGPPRDVMVPDLSLDVDGPPCPEPPATMLRATKFAIHTAGIPGKGMDVDGDPETCAPTTNVAVTCSGGIDNALAGLAGLANGSIGLAVTKRDLNLLFVPEPPTPDGDCFVLLARFADGTKGADDAWTYAILAGESEPPCADGAAFLDACVAGDALTGGFATTVVFPLRIPLLGIPLEVPVHDARIEGTVTTGADGSWTRLDALIAGVVYKDEFDALLAQLPDDLGDVPTMVYNVVKPDLDLDGDGTADAISAGLQIEAEPATVTGFAPGDGG